MKNNKGFTIIELIVTIAIMATLCLVVGVSITNMIQGQQTKEIEEFKNKVENAACVYAELNNLSVGTTKTYTLNELIKRGLLDKDLEDPENNKKISEESSRKVKVTWDSNEKICNLE